ncbi:MAG: response regulator transcription factor [Bacteroidetes bacterium]|nr:response regulator transcription factor [Bacteroidota bacterium]
MTSTAHKILLVDDEPDILEFLGYNLKREGYTIFTASNGRDAISTAKKENPELIILDLMMPEMDGMEVCRELRKISSLKNVMIAFLTARNEDYSQITGFDSGADDYITKPIKPNVFVSRVKALLRRVEKNLASNIIELSGIKIDKEKHLVEKEGIKIVFPKKEFDLLYLLISKPGKVFKRDEILQKVWGDDVIVGDRTIDVHIRKLREKIGDDYFKTVKGVGYKFEF